MGFFNWLLSKPAAPRSAAVSSQTDIHATLADATRPFSGGKAPTAATNQNANSVAAQRLEQRRSERNARRELLFQVVRESMVRVGILSSAFKFKVLALDQRGRTFLVMIDLSSEFAGETDKLSEIEALIAQSAKTRFELIVQAVYWRFYEAVAVSSAARAGNASAPAPLFGLPSSSRPAPLSAQPFPNVPPAARPVAAVPTRPAAPVASPAVGTDPLQDEEIDAFKRALASGMQPGLSIPLGGATPSFERTQQIAPRQPAPAAAALPKMSNPAMASAALVTPATAAAAAKAASLAAIHNKLLLTGYEDTEMPDSDEPAPALSATQYGELR